VYAAKRTNEKQALVVGAKESRQAVKADRLTRQPGCQADKTGSPACFFVPGTRVLVF